MGSEKAFPSAIPCRLILNSPCPTESYLTFSSWILAAIAGMYLPANDSPVMKKGLSRYSGNSFKNWIMKL